MNAGWPTRAQVEDYVRGVINTGRTNVPAIADEIFALFPHERLLADFRWLAEHYTECPGDATYALYGDGMTRAAWNQHVAPWLEKKR